MIDKAMISFNHKPVVIVTGASRGIGEKIALALAAAGAHPVMIARTKNKLAALAEKIKSTGGVCTYFAADITDHEAIKDIVNNQLDKVDGLVNNAGSAVIKHFEDYSEADFDTLINLNVKSYFFLSQLVANKMKKNADKKSGDMIVEGGIVNISSIMGKVAQPINTPRPQVLYTLTKHAVEGLTKALSVELARFNIRVNSVCPTYVETELTKKTLQNETQREFLLDRIPLKRFANTSDVANAVLFLLSGLSSMITGESIMVDGGWTAQ
jgi:NAD(P)-dependent dehydrogenase (short-subunit alcohol dehydrogenase family)